MSLFLVLVSLTLPLSMPADPSDVALIRDDVVTITNLPADASITATKDKPGRYTNQYTFFSFKKGKIVPNSDSLSTGWDIGFKGTSIIINGGPSRKGQGGLALYEGKFDEVKTAPSSLTFITDSGDAPALPTGSGNGWYSYNPATHEITPIPGRILIVRRADGNYTKLEIQSYYKNQDASAETRYYTFRYQNYPSSEIKTAN